MSESKILEYVAQPDGNTCQAACIAKAIGTTDVWGVRNDLLQLGVAGDPAVMGEYLRRYVDHYEFTANGSLDDAAKWLDAESRVIITHGWFTSSGHVISLVGTERIGMKDYFMVDDPWGEFMFADWRYGANWNGNDRSYSRYGLYAACIAGASVTDAYRIYKRGELDSTRKGGWFHLITN